ncbi:hypothetical protein ABVT39_007439 [Epinephelus coioides]
MQESPSQEAPHSTGDFSASSSPTTYRSTLTDAIPQTEPIKERINWPKMSKAKEWANFDEDLDRVLEVTLPETVEWKVNYLTEITYNLEKERFGAIERKVNTKATKQPNRTTGAAEEALREEEHRESIWARNKLTSERRLLAFPRASDSGTEGYCMDFNGLVLGIIYFIL